MAIWNMRNRIFFSLALILLLLLTQAIFISCKKKDLPQDKQPPAKQIESDKLEKIDLRILYAGHPESEREKDFVNFLTNHFKQVDTCDLKSLSESHASNFDVSILDYDINCFKAPRPVITKSFSRPIVTVGVAGALMCSSWNLKTGYL